MKTLLFLLLSLCLIAIGHGKNKKIAYEVLHDDPFFLRDKDERHFNDWTSNPEKAAALLEKYRIKKEFKLPEGGILAILLSDRITYDLVRITFDAPSATAYAEYKDSGIRYKLAAPPVGKKYSHLTAVVFTSPVAPKDFHLRAKLIGGDPDGE